MRPILAVDWDGTCVEGKWPDMGNWLPGAVYALRELSKHYRVLIWTARIAPVEVYDWNVPRAAGTVEREINTIRHKLDSAGLTQIEVFTGGFKPGAARYVDDKAITYTGRPGSWRAITTKLLALLDDHASLALFPGHMYGEEEESARDRVGHRR